MNQHRLCMAAGVGGRRGGGRGGGREAEIQVSVVAPPAGTLASSSPLGEALRHHDGHARLWRQRWGRWRCWRWRSRGSVQPATAVHGLLVGGQRHLDALHHDGAGLARHPLLPPGGHRGGALVRLQEIRATDGVRATVPLLSLLKC